MIVLDYWPLRIVERRGFTKLITIIAPEFKIPSRNTIKSRIEKEYCDKKKKITELDRIEYVSLTTDTWICMTEKACILPVNRLISQEIIRVIG